MTDPDWGDPEPILPDPPTPADDEDQRDRFLALDLAEADE